MKTHICPNCQTETRSCVTRCEHCQADLGENPPPSIIAEKTNWIAKLSIRFSIYGFILLIPIIGFWVWGQPRDSLGFGDLLIMVFAIGIPVLATSGLIFSLIALAGRDKGSAFVGIAANSLVIIVYISPYFLPRDHKPRRSACVDNLKQLGLVLAMYADENGGQFPPIDDTRNNFIFEGGSIYPEYLTDASILACPEDPEFDMRINFKLRAARNGDQIGDVHPDCITDMSYCYLGWVITNDEEAETFFKIYDKMLPEDYDKDIIVPDGRGNGGGNVIYRFRQEMTRFPNKYGIDPAKTPIVWDKPSADFTSVSHVPVGYNVLYLDGHVEFLRLDPKYIQFPASLAFGTMLDERPRAPIPNCE